MPIKPGDLIEYQTRGPVARCSRCSFAGRKACVCTGDAVVWSAAPGARVWAHDTVSHRLVLLKLATPKRPGHYLDDATQRQWEEARK